MPETIIIRAIGALRQVENYKFEKLDGYLGDCTSVDKDIAMRLVNRPSPSFEIAEPSDQFIKPVVLVGEPKRKGRPGRKV